MIVNLLSPMHNLHSNLAIHGTALRVPVVGDGATVCYAKDRHAGTVIAYDEARKIVTVRQDKATRTDNLGMSDSQDYSYEANENGSTWSFKFKNNRWRECVKGETGRWKLYKTGNGLILGIRDEFYDFTF